MKKQARSIRRWLTTGLCLSLALLGAGCGSKGTVSGKVLYKGQPLNGGVVTFLTDQDKPLTSQIDANGNYRIADVPPGGVKITVYVPAPPKLPSAFNKGGGKSYAPPGVLPEGIELTPKQGKASDLRQIDPKYSDVASSGLALTVKGGSQEHTIDLK
jgi:hypothetical protein